MQNTIIYSFFLSSVQFTKYPLDTFYKIRTLAALFLQNLESNHPLYFMVKYKKVHIFNSWATPAARGQARLGSHSHMELFSPGQPEQLGQAAQHGAAAASIHATCPSPSSCSWLKVK